MATQNLSIMFTDIKGFTERTSGSSRAGMKSLLAEHDRLLVPVFEHFDGRIVKTIGDAFLVVFGSPTDAVLCGVTVQEVLRQHNLVADAQRRIEVRVAINVGEVELKDNDVLGEPVNIAARLEGVTEAGEVWFTDAVYQTMNRSEAPSADVGEKLFKGIPYPVRVYRVLHEPGSELATRLANGVRLSDRGPVLLGGRGDAVRRRRLKRTAALSLAMGVLALCGLAALMLLPDAAGRALESAHTELAAGRPAAALEIARAALAAHPGETALTDFAAAAAAQHLDQLAARGEHAAALAWLRQTLDDLPYLQSLRPRLVELDARVAVAAALDDPAQRGDYYPRALKELLSRHDGNPQAARLADSLLAGKGDAMTRVWLQGSALAAGLGPDEAIFEFNVSLQQGTRLDWQLLDASRALLLGHYRERSLAWAADAVQAGRAMVFMNASRLLRETGDPRLDEPWYASLGSLFGAADAAVVDAAHPVFLQQRDAARRAQLLALLGDLVDTFPAFVNSTGVRDRLIVERAALALEWAPQS